MKRPLPDESEGEVAAVPDEIDTEIERNGARMAELTCSEITRADDTDGATETASRSSDGIESECASDRAGLAMAGWRKIRVLLGMSSSRLAARAVLPGLALLLAIGAGFLAWQDLSAHRSESARIQSVAAAKDATVAILSYQPDSVEKDLGGVAEEKLTGAFKESYSQLVHDVVIPGAKQHQISTTVTIPAAASVSATPDRAVVLVFLNQTVVVGDEQPSESGSSVRVTLDKVDGRWLVSTFEPV